MDFYKNEPSVLLAVDCVIFGFNGDSLDILLFKRAIEPEINKWSLPGGFVQAEESPEVAAARVLKKLTGLGNIYVEESAVFGNPKRESHRRVVSITYYALIDVHKYQHVITDDYEARWFPLNDCPPLIFDHEEMIRVAKGRLRSKAALYPILFELLPEKFTLPQIATLYEKTYDIVLDRRNFNRKLLGSGLLIKLKEKDKTGSRRGAYYFKLDKKVYKEKIMSFLRYLPSWNIDSE